MSTPPGYLNDPELTAKAFVEIEGKRYYRTGDVGEMEPSTPGSRPRIKVIDRASAFFKTSQGEWLSPTEIEALLEECPWVTQALVLGSTDKSFLVAVVVPSSLALSSLPSEPDAAAQQMLLRELRVWCRHHHLRPMLTPQAVHLETEAWSPDNGGLTGTLKKRRGWLERRYAQVKAELYATVEGQAGKGGEGQQLEASLALSSELSALLAQVLPPGAGAGAGREDFLGQVMVGGDVDDEDEGEDDDDDENGDDLTLGFHRLRRRDFLRAELPSQIGGDSLTAARLAALLNARGLAAVTVRAMYEYPLGHFSDLLDRAGSPSVIPTAAPIRAPIDWKAEAALPPTLPEVAAPPEPGRTAVLMTGCTGFLGPVLLSEILRVFPQAEVFCLVRGASPERARARLEEGIRSTRLEVPDEAMARVTVLMGELTRERFGLGEEEYGRLLEKVGVIVHNGEWLLVTGIAVMMMMIMMMMMSTAGATVNMAIPYSAMREANVTGTLRIIDLAMHSGASVHYVSSVAALPTQVTRNLTQIVTQDVTRTVTYICKTGDRI
jgi:fatty acid CoA ligase FadD9